MKVPTFGIVMLLIAIVALASTTAHAYLEEASSSFAEFASFEAESASELSSEFVSELSSTELTAAVSAGHAQQLSDQDLDEIVVAAKIALYEQIPSSQMLMGQRAAYHDAIVSSIFPNGLPETAADADAGALMGHRASQRDLQANLQTNLQTEPAQAVVAPVVSQTTSPLRKALITVALVSSLLTVAVCVVAAGRAVVYQIKQRKTKVLPQDQSLLTVETDDSSVQHQAEFDHPEHAPQQTAVDVYASYKPLE